LQGFRSQGWCFPSLRGNFPEDNKLKRIFRGLGNCQKLRNIDLSYNQLDKLPRELGWIEGMRKIISNKNPILTLPGELCFLNPSLILELNECPMKYPFREWYIQGTPLLMDNIKPYCSAYPMATVASGPELNVTQAGKPNTFLITACDKKGNRRPNGGDNFTGRVLDKENNVAAEVIVHDEKNGTYNCYFNCQKSGEYTIEVLNEGATIKGSPYSLVVYPGPIDALSCVISGDNLKEAAIGKEASFKIQTKDKFGNIIEKGGASLKVTIEGGSNPKPYIQDLGDGTYTVLFTCGWADDYEINVFINGTKLSGCPYYCSAK